MAEGKPPRSGSEIERTKITGHFHWRVWLWSPEETRPADDVFEAINTVVAGCRCTGFVSGKFGNSDPKICRRVWLGLHARHDPVLGGEGDPKVSAHMVLLDNTGSPATSVVTSIVTDNDHVKGFYALTADWDDIEANCLVDNYFVVLCSVDIDWTPSASSVKEDLGHDLGIMSDKKDLTDVSFNVGGENFSAHRLVLATRSPVFRAELYGPMVESKMAAITVKDMEASTFRSMLHYIYHGSLSTDDCSKMAQYQHLLVAADRYQVEGLKKICEDKLSNCIKIDSVVSMLELAEDHICPKLKARCFDFLADGDNFKMVAISDEYIRLIQTFPNLIVEVRNKMKMALEGSATMNPCSHKKSRVC